MPFDIELRYHSAAGSRVVAGPAGSIITGEIADYYPFKKWRIEHLVGKTQERKKGLVPIRVRGDSMAPTINQGEIALVDTHGGERLDIRTGQIYVERNLTAR